MPLGASSVHAPMGCGDIASGRSTWCKPAGPGVRLPPQNHRDTSGSTGRRNGVAAVLPAQLRAQGSPQTHGASRSTHSPACLRPTPRGGARHLAGAWTARAGARSGGALGGGSVDGTCRCPGRWSPRWRGRGRHVQVPGQVEPRVAGPWTAWPGGARGVSAQSLASSRTEQTDLVPDFQGSLLWGALHSC